MTTTEALSIMLAHVHDPADEQTVVEAFSRAVAVMRKPLVAMSAVEVRIVKDAWKRAGRAVRVRGRKN